MPIEQRGDILAMHWTILTGEYPPQPGGVSDYTLLVADALAECGDEVEIWAPPAGAGDLACRSSSITLHRLPDHYRWRSLALLRRAFRKLPSKATILVQYVPHAFGRRGVNLSFCLWLWLQRKRLNIVVLFHEVATPWRSGPKIVRPTLLAVLTRAMATMVARSARKMFVSIPAWAELVRRLGGNRSVEWLPIPSTMPTNVNSETIVALRSQLLDGRRYLVGHFGTHGGHVAEALRQVLPDILGTDGEAKIVLIGRGAEKLTKEIFDAHPDLVDRIIPRGESEPASISHHLAACDVIVQPFVDGISSRRTSVMASLALGLPIVTNKGFLSEPLWSESRAVQLAESIGEIPAHVNRLLHDEEERARLRQASLALYLTKFQLSRTIDQLRRSGSQTQQCLGQSNER